MPKGNKNPSGNPETMHCRKCGAEMENGVCPKCGYKVYVPMDEKKALKIRLSSAGSSSRVYYLGNRHASKGITKKTASAVFIYIISRAFLFLGRARRVRPE